VQDLLILRYKNNLIKSNKIWIGDYLWLKGINARFVDISTTLKRANPETMLNQVLLLKKHLPTGVVQAAGRVKSDSCP